MLLANAAAARLVAAAFPERAMLRCHPPPNERKLADLEQFAREQGLEVDASSAAALHRSLARLRESHRDGYEIVQLLATLPMQLARYFSTGAQDPDTWGHYALAAPRYTHFTSPIRRYPDVLVHRQVAAALDAGFTPTGFRGGILGERGAAASPAPRGGRGGGGGGGRVRFARFRNPESVRRALQRAQARREGCAGRLVARLPVRVPARIAHGGVWDRARGGAQVPAGVHPRLRVRGARARRGAQARHRDERGARRRRRRGGAGVRADSHAGGPADGIRPGRGAGRAQASHEGVARRARPLPQRLGGGARGAPRRGGVASASPRGERSDDEDVFACGAPPRRLPATIRPVERVCLLLGATFPARAKPEMTAALLLRNPLAEA